MVIYAFTNPAMPGLVKIGKVEEVGRIQQRLAELYRGEYKGATGVPVPFQCEFVVQFDDEEDWERIFHRLFAKARINPKREFFELAVEDLIPVLRKCGQDVTPSLDTPDESISQDEVDSGERLRAKRRPPMHLPDLNIQDGAQLVWTRDSEQKCRVVNAREQLVQLLGEEMEMTLKEATIGLLGNPPWRDRARPALYWEYEGELLARIYDEKHPREQEDRRKGVADSAGVPGVEHQVACSGDESERMPPVS